MVTGLLRVDARRLRLLVPGRLRLLVACRLRLLVAGLLWVDTGAGDQVSFIGGYQGGWQRRRGFDAVNTVERQVHRNTELFKVEAAIFVYIC